MLCETDNGTDNVSATNRQQTDNKSDNKTATKFHLADLSGIQERALLFIFESCRYNARRESDPVINSQIAEVLKTTPHSAKVSLQRLEAKGFVRRLRSKNGRGGWAVFELPEEVHRDLTLQESKFELATKRQQSGNKATAEPTTKPTTTSPSSSSSELEVREFNTTTTADALLGSGWDEIDISLHAIREAHAKKIQLRS